LGPNGKYRKPLALVSDRTATNAGAPAIREYI
jgi:hypothetical protein